MRSHFLFHIAAMFAASIAIASCGGDKTARG